MLEIRIHYYEVFCLGMLDTVHDGRGQTTVARIPLYDLDPSSPFSKFERDVGRSIL